MKKTIINCLWLSFLVQTKRPSYAQIFVICLHQVVLSLKETHPSFFIFEMHLMGR